MNRPIYLDYMATTPVDEEVITAMMQCMSKESAFGNSASASHYYGFQAKELVDKARQQVATTIGADPREIIWTSGATEANNLALQGAAHFYRRQGKHIITMQTEHKAVLDVCQHLAAEGFEITYLKPHENGLLDLMKLKNALRPDTILVSIMQVNNETGIIQDIRGISEIVKTHSGALLHVDAAQSIGKISVDVNELAVDLLSMSAHKAYGPKGIGALYLRRQPRVRLQPILFGGGHEHGLRSGTLAVHQIVGMGVAFQLAEKKLIEDNARIMRLRQQFWQGLQKLEGVRLNTDATAHIPHCLNICFSGIDGEALMVSLRQVAVSSGSACNSANPEPSHVLLAMGVSRMDANNSLRISLGRYTTAHEIELATQYFSEQVTRLRQASPIWEKIKLNLKNR
ncbi:MAG: IscS subfamily cysteine desulfurase [Coxiella sp. RIFCSPHIGHO2_12_FULL_42_15]|nr:MAG: IscS subfamily cysteine desulfurase [Coxiella sp. RIFCSPHIGHO2_12_FULL_42_15]